MSAPDDPVLFAKKLLGRAWLKESATQTYQTATKEELRQACESLLQSAVNPEPHAFDLLVLLAAMSLREGDPLPNWLATFAAGVLSGEIKRPRRRGVDVLKIARDFGFWRTSLEIAQRYDLPLYTNNELSEKTTAAEIVSQAAGCRVDVIVQAIKKSQRKFGGRKPRAIFPQDSGG